MKTYRVVYRVIDDIGEALAEENIVADGFAIADGGHFLFHVGTTMIKVIGSTALVFIEQGEGEPEKQQCDEESRAPSIGLGDGAETQK